MIHLLQSQVSKIGHMNHALKVYVSFHWQQRTQHQWAQMKTATTKSISEGGGAEPHLCPTNRLRCQDWILSDAALVGKKVPFSLILKTLPKSAPSSLPLHMGAVLLFPSFWGSCHLELHSMSFQKHFSKCSPCFLRHFPSSAAFSWVHLSLAAAFHHPICCLASDCINHFSAWKRL